MTIQSLLLHSSEYKKVRKRCSLPPNPNALVAFSALTLLVGW